MSADRSQTTHPSAPMNDREFAVWEHGRIQGHNEAKREIDRLRATVRELRGVPTGDIEDGFIRDSYGEWK